MKTYQIVHPTYGILQMIYANVSYWFPYSVSPELNILPVNKDEVVTILDYLEDIGIFPEELDIIEFDTELSKRLYISSLVLLRNKMGLEFTGSPEVG